MVRIEKDHPMRKESTEALLELVKKNSALERVLENPCHDKFVKSLRATREQALAVLKGRKVELPEHL